MKTTYQSIVIIGATSAIAQECARLWAKDGARFFLVGRNEEHLLSIAQDLTARGAKHVSVSVADLRARDAHQAIVDASVTTMQFIDAVLIAHGTLPNQDACVESMDVTMDALLTNGISAISFMHRYAHVMVAQEGGEIGVISSVAGERGRGSNYTYGAAKAAVTAYASGLRARLADTAVQVTTILPGFVDTPMTSHVKKGLLFASAASVGKLIVKAMEARRDVVYVPAFWKWIMLVVRAVPEGVFKRLKF